MFNGIVSHIPRLQMVCNGSTASTTHSVLLLKFTLAIQRYVDSRAAEKSLDLDNVMNFLAETKRSASAIYF